MAANIAHADAPLWQYKPPPALTKVQFERWQYLLEQRTGISYALHQSILQAGIYRRMVEVDCKNYDQYFQLVRGEDVGNGEWEELLNQITVRDTRFFRDNIAFRYLQAYLQQRIASLKHRKELLQIWSAGCASGEEAWSLAMLASHCIGAARAKVEFGVIGSDISNAALRTARSGVYREQALGELEAHLRERFVVRQADGKSRIIDSLAGRVCFVNANLLAEKMRPGVSMDVIFCQNVLIYFRQTQRQEVLNHLVEQLKPGGLLVLGAGESSGWQHSGVNRIHSRQLDAFTRLQITR